MRKRIYSGFSEDRYTWKNSHRKHSKLSKYKIDRILNCFVHDLTITEAWQALSTKRNKPTISKKTVGRKYLEMRLLFVTGALNYLELFGGAGSMLLVGYPPTAIADRIEKSRLFKDHKPKESDIRVRRYNKSGGWIDDPHTYSYFERALREYAWRNLAIDETWVVADFSLIKLCKYIDESEKEEWLHHGGDYIAEKNWTYNAYDYGLREDELWGHIYSKGRISDEAYYDRMLRDMKWLMNRHPLGTEVRVNLRTELCPPYTKLRKASLAWFPDGYKLDK